MILHLEVAAAFASEITFGQSLPGGILLYVPAAVAVAAATAAGYYLRKRKPPSG